MDMVGENKQESQFELFSVNRDPLPAAKETSAQYKHLTVSQEHIIVLSIIFIVAGVICFSLGVERGKRLNFVAVKREIKSNPMPLVSQTNKVVSDQSASVIQPLSETEGQPSAKMNTSTPVIMNVALNSNVKTYTIQVASYKTQEKAKQAASNIQGHETFVVPKGSYSILCVGKFTEKQQAQNILKKMKKKYNDCFVRSI